MSIDVFHVIFENLTTKSANLILWGVLLYGVIVTNVRGCLLFLGIGYTNYFLVGGSATINARALFLRIALKKVLTAKHFRALKLRWKFNKIYTTWVSSLLIMNLPLHNTLRWGATVCFFELKNTNFIYVVGPFIFKLFHDTFLRIQLKAC